MEQKVRLVRTGTPSTLDEAPAGSICTVYKDNGMFEIYIQRNKDDETPPRWELIGEFDEYILEDTVNVIMKE